MNIVPIGLLISFLLALYVANWFCRQDNGGGAGAIMSIVGCAAFFAIFVVGAISTVAVQGLLGW